MNPIVSLVTKVEVATEVAAVAGVANMDGPATVVGATAADGFATADGACCPMGIMDWLRIQVSPHHYESKKETGLMDRR